MTLLNKALRYTIALALSGLGALVVAAPSACGGCYNDEQITDLRIEPASGCLTVTSSGVNPCTGAYDIAIDNSCSEDFQLFTDNTLIGAGESGRIDGSSAESRGDTRALEGTLGSTPTEILWRLVEPED